MTDSGSDSRFTGIEREGLETSSLSGKTGEGSSKMRPRDVHFSIFLFPFPRSLFPAVSPRGERPTSSFVHPGMWDILTGWLFIDSTQLRVPPVALSLSLSGVCFDSIISVISQPGLTQEDRVLRNTSQRVCGELHSRDIQTKYWAQFSHCGTTNL